MAEKVYSTNWLSYPFKELERRPLFTQFRLIDNPYEYALYDAFANLPHWLSDCVEVISNGDEIIARFNFEFRDGEIRCNCHLTFS